MYSLLAVCLLLATMTGGTDSREELNTKVAYTLWKATQERDPSAYPLVNEVLLDMAEQRYEYLRDVRLNAFDYIEATGDTRVLPLLEEIAGLPSSTEDSLEATLDAYAISEALEALIDFGSDESAELSRRHIFSHPLVQLVAIRNLKQLAVWEATPEVELMFCSTQPIGDNHVELARAAEFLEASPATTNAICLCMEKVTKIFHDKLERSGTDPLYDFYGKLGQSIKTLTARLACSS